MMQKLSSLPAGEKYSVGDTLYFKLDERHAIPIKIKKTDQEDFNILVNGKVFEIDPEQEIEAVKGERA